MYYERFQRKSRGRKMDGITGEYGLGIQNERGDKLLEFCIANNLTVAEKSLIFVLRCVFR